MRALRTAAIASCLLAPRAWAHGGAHAEPEENWRALLHHWTWDPWIISLLLLSAVAYAFGARRMQRWEVVFFSAGLLSVVVALLSPLDALSDVLFAAHMSQHEVLMLVSAPLLVLGKPLLAYLWALPERARLRVGEWLSLPRWKQVWGAITQPFVVLIVHGAAVWLWHVPRLFEAALASESVHAVQHACFFLTAALFWWALLHGRYGRAGYGVGVIYVFATATHTGLLGALVTVAGRAWYPSYVARTPSLGVNALEDQQLAGLIMWIPASVLLLVVALAMLMAWLGEAERRVALGRTDRLSRSARLSPPEGTS